jgi:two-component system, NarL family, response regulator NreC
MWGIFESEAPNVSHRNPPGPHVSLERTEVRMPIRVLVADDHALVRQSLRLLLEQEGFEVIGEASDGQAALEQARSLDPDVVVMDISMPTSNGIEAARGIRLSCPKTKTIMVTQYEEPQFVAGAVEAGVKGYVLKSQTATDLINAIRQVSRGEVYLSPSISATLANAYREKSEHPKDPLTARERQVLQLIAEGKSTKDVAGILGISAKTAESHRSRLMRKLDIHETASLVLYAVRRGIVQP